MPNSVPETPRTLIRIKMLGGFELSVGTCSVGDDLNRTHQLWHLIQFLIMSRHRALTQKEISGVLWPHGGIENPHNALKNLVYRIRTILTKQGIPYAKEMIVFSGGTYRWNNELPCEVDTEIFLECCDNGKNTALSAAERIGEFRRAIELYTGDFLPSSKRERWVMPEAERYRRNYFECVHGILNLLESESREREIEEICARAEKIDRFDEGVHLYLMRSFIRSENHARAIAHYGRVTEMFLRELGSAPPASVRELYREIMQSTRGGVSGIEDVQDDLSEPGDIAGAFCCDYEVFKNLYRREAREAARTGASIFICLLTIEPNNRRGEPDSARAMEGLRDAIRGSLRKGDVYACFSATQYVIMLPTPSYANCEMIVGRVLKNYRRLRGVSGDSIHVKVQPLTPA